ncbi:envelope stress response membrane protein PspB [Pleionea sediminis]|uniref:envelope stress response membrane protein PspB n=1 Tax=Pleionea sediminis TaxID=2569479 RepID=UPI0011859AE7|nr:envelope stress response membrane protein PspB [Pleionea sediminis]
MFDTVLVLFCIFAIIVGPYWLKLHYKEKKESRNISPDTECDLKSLDQLATDLQHRVKVLESILDNESPDWRKKYG